MPLTSHSPNGHTNSAASMVVLWQTLVTSSARSLWRELRQVSSWELTMIAPTEFREGGMQQLVCAPNDPRNPKLVTLPVKRWHTQAVRFKGLVPFLKKWMSSRQSRKIFLCFAEPYSVTAFLAWVSINVARILTLGRSARPVLLVYSFQNIFKEFPLPIKIIQSLIFHICDGILVAGKEHESVLRKHGYRGPCVTLPMWYDREFFHWNGSQLTNPKIRIGYAGSLLPEKGILQVLEHMNLHAAKLVECEVHIAGGGILQNSVADQISRLNQQGVAAKYLGPLSVASIADFYKSIDILMVPSRTAAHWKEQFGRVIIEAMACGCLVIGSDSGEIPHVINQPDRIFPEHDLDAFLKVLTAAVSKVRQERASIRHEIAYTEATRFSDDVVAKKFHNDLDNWLRSLPHQS